MTEQQLDDTAVYRNLLLETGAVLRGETQSVSIMSTLACLVKHALPKVYWVGFYLNTGSYLTIGPYQGTLGCLRIAYDRGVCGRAFRERAVQLVGDVHADPEHIACDEKSRSEIVVPVLRKDGSVYAVLDVDSHLPDAFSETDVRYLQELVSVYLEPYI